MTVYTPMTHHDCDRHIRHFYVVTAWPFQCFCLRPRLTLSLFSHWRVDSVAQVFEGQFASLCHGYQVFASLFQFFAFKFKLKFLLNDSVTDE